MKRTLYLKFLIAYFLFAAFGFLAVGTFVSSLTLEHSKRERAESLYSEATQIADTYASDLYNSETSIATVQEQLSVLSKYLKATIWIINPSGRLVIDSAKTLDADQEADVKGFDPTITGGTYYTIGNFFGSFEDKELECICADYCKLYGKSICGNPYTDEQH